MNIGNRYKAQKENVIDIFNTYVEKRGSVYDGNNLEHWQSRVNNLQNGKFTLTVAGEISAGKSTFINALLGEELLPTGEEQLTNAIVELKRAEDPFIKVTFADKKEEIFEYKHALKEKLEELCTIPKKYKAIPTTLLDKYIQRKDDVLKVDDIFIQQLEEDSGIKNLDSHSKLIQEYTNHRPQKNIPVEIEVGYPLKWDFSELRIVDSPGVNALGGVQDATYEYLNSSNAVLFVHKITPVESQSLRKFVEKQIATVSRTRETLFLILTRAGLLPEGVIESQLETAVDLYSDIIPRERIIAVDSLLKVIHNDFSNGKTYEEIRQDHYKKPALSYYKDEAEDKEQKLEDVILEGSRFGKMEKAIDDFAMNAPFLQLKEIVEAVKKGYNKQEILCDEKIGLLVEKRKEPTEFIKSIEKINKDLSEWKLIQNKTGHKLQQKYLDKHTNWVEKVESLKILYPENFSNSSNTEAVRHEFSNAKSNIIELIDQFSADITIELKKKLKQEADRFKANHQITLPEIDLDAIEESSKKTAFETKDTTEEQWVKIGKERKWYTLWLIEYDKKERKEVVVGQEDVFNEEKYLGAYKSKITKSFYSLINELPEKFEQLLSQYITSFKNQVNTIISDRKNDLERIKNEQKGNDELIAEVKSLRSKKKDIKPELESIEEILGDLK
jgi:hypothetical protein